MNWYSIKTVFRWTRKNDPQAKDKFFDNEIDLAEERILLVNAESESEAINKAEEDSKKYERQYKNPYGQIISIEYIECLDIVELYDSPNDLVEVYSSTRIISTKLSNNELSDLILGPVETNEETGLRNNFLNSGPPN